MTTESINLTSVSTPDCDSFFVLIIAIPKITDNLAVIHGQVSGRISDSISVMIVLKKIPMDMTFRKFPAIALCGILVWGALKLAIEPVVKQEEEWSSKDWL